MLFQKRCCWIVATIIILLLLLNCLSETFPFHSYKANGYEKAELKLFSLNVCCLGNDYNKRQIKIAHAILNSNPDVVFLCEFWMSKSKQLDSMLTKDYKCIYVSGNNCVFYCKHEIDSIKDMFSGLYNTRHSQTVMTHFFKGRDTFAIVGCHLSSSHHHIKEGYKRREKEADVLYDVIRKEPYPVIVMGDLNDISGSYTIRRIQKAGLSDAWWEGGCGYGTTFHDGWLRLRIDHVLYPKNKLNLQNIKVIDSDLSDHNALIAEFIWK